MPTWTLLPSWHKYPTAVPCGHLLRQVSFCICLSFLFYPSVPIADYLVPALPTESFTPLRYNSVMLIKHILALIMRGSWLFSLGQGCKHWGSSCWTCTLANKKPAYFSLQAIHVAGIQLHGMPIWPLLQLCCPHSTLRALLSWVLLPGWSFLSITTWWVVLCEHQCLHLLVSSNWQQDSFKKASFCSSTPASASS